MLKAVLQSPQFAAAKPDEAVVVCVLTDDYAKAFAKIHCRYRGEKFPAWVTVIPTASLVEWYPKQFKKTDFFVGCDKHVVVIRQLPTIINIAKVDNEWTPQLN